MAQQTAGEYLARLGGGDPRAGMRVAVQALQAKGYQVGPGPMLRTPGGRLTFCTSPFALEAQIVACHKEATAAERGR